jgi:hypothetical protein
MFFSYSIATLTTLEKQFKLKSQTTGNLQQWRSSWETILSCII